MPKHPDHRPTVIVPLYEIAAELGGLVEYAQNRAEAFGFPVVEDWRGYPGVPVEHAAELVGRVRADNEAHRDRWASYQNYLAERRQKAADERQRVIDEARRQARESARRAGEQWAAKARQQAEQEGAERAAKEAARAGAPDSWENYSKKAG